MRMLHRMVDEGNTVVVIEHDVDVIAEGDYLVELGPKGGEEGGYLLHQGTVRRNLCNRKSKTGPFLKGVVR